MINRPFSEVFGSKDSKFLEATLARLFTDDASDVQPWDWRSRDEEFERLVKSVVRADREIGSCICRFFNRCKHQVGNGFPVVRANGCHVPRHRDRIHRHFRMIMLAEKFLCLKADRAITKRRSFCTSSNNSDVFSHYDSIIPAPRSKHSPSAGDEVFESRMSGLGTRLSDHQSAIRFYKIL